MEPTDIAMSWRTNRLSAVDTAASRSAPAYTIQPRSPAVACP